jgi:Ca-activated chloride channel family protein
VTDEDRADTTEVRAAFVLVLASASLLAQQAPPVFKSSVDIVPVYATVTDLKGTFTHGLIRDDFEVLDDGKPQQIVSFSEEAQAISVSVILDTSGSMAEARPKMLAAAAVFLDQLRPDDRAMLGSLVYAGRPFTSDKARLRSAMDLIPPDPGSPIWAALDRAVAALQPETQRRVIVIYTDGQNTNIGQYNFLKADESSVRERLETEGVMLYAIGFQGVSLAGGIKNIARRSGGRATELGKNDDLAKALTAIADELHHQYLIGFTPAVFDGKSHKIEVRLKKTDLTVRARQQYVAVRKQ